MKGQSIQVREASKIKIFLEMIKFEHTIFALPFAYLGLVLGSMWVFGQWPTLYEWVFATLAMVGARTAAMSLNRLIDRAIDAKNPRTASRALPRGLLSIREVWLYIILSFALLFFAAAMLNPLAVKLLPLAVFVLVFYSYTKRFTWTSHLVLGVALGLAPLGGWVAATGRLDWVSLPIFFAVMFWTAGFDVVYATQDEDFDRAHGLHSIPVRFGLARSLLIARVFHLISVFFLLLLWYTAGLNVVYGLGVLLAALILLYEHSIISPRDMSRLDMAFFTMNGILSVVVFAATVLALMTRHLI
ncbi:MAG: 4-hydroxybenzoate polyprenyltransferase [Candidatus Carbobacillus altaicus]|uniref:4-hydroxybenzoate polyprenyltransferase n=1 Tax=Candidatus Carbonibacillus altaicus TaxID=2163959 RepID=A0A2R6Y1P8_9BACL|nr:MAG: 4-hydroxybenzoate polyprenyltransferase [Candidatus Carbobacillus altaicus]